MKAVLCPMCGQPMSPDDYPDGCWRCKGVPIGTATFDAMLDSVGIDKDAFHRARKHRFYQPKPRRRTLYWYLARIEKFFSRALDKPVVAWLVIAACLLAYGFVSRRMGK